MIPDPADPSSDAFSNAQTESHLKTVFQRQIEAIDRQINQLVYELYGLTDDEVKLVEAATS